MSVTTALTGALLAAGDGEESSPNPLVPEMYDIVWSLVIVVIIAVVFLKYVLPKFQEVLDERSEKIKGGIDKADEAQAKADALLEENQALLREARSEAARIREEARTEGSQIVAEHRERASAEASRILETAQRQIDAERQQAATSLRSDVGALAVDLASKIVGESLDDVARQSRVVDRFLDDLDGASLTTKGK